jgi:hypothetical protein
VVAEVRVHRHQEIVVMLDRAMHCLEDGCAEPEFAWPVQHADAMVARSEFICELARPVGGIVVDYKDVGQGGIRQKFHD